MRMLRILLAMALAGWLSIAAAQELVKIPPLTGHVVDQVGLLKESERASLDQLLTEYETRTGAQVAVLLIASTAPEAIEQYSIRVADAWKLGRKKVDDGVILLVAKDNPKTLHRLRIEAGRGVQGSLTDLQSKRILQEVIAPYFQRSDFNGGLAAGVVAITALLDKEHLPAAPPAPEQRTSADNSSAGGNGGGGSGIMMPLIFLAVFVMIVIGFRSRRGSSVLDHDAWGNAAGIILGGVINSVFNGIGGSSGGSSGGGMSGGGGGFDGGGASGDW